MTQFEAQGKDVLNRYWVLKNIDLELNITKESLNTVRALTIFPSSFCVDNCSKNYKTIWKMP